MMIADHVSGDEVALTGMLMYAQQHPPMAPTIIAYACVEAGLLAPLVPLNALGSPHMSMFNIHSWVSFVSG